MKLTTFFLLMAFMAAAHRGNTQQVTLSVKNETLSHVFQQIERQTGYLFFYTSSDIKKAKKISLQTSKASLDQVLQIVFKGQPLTYEVIDKTIVVKPKVAVELQSRELSGLGNEPPPIDVKGRIVNERGEPVIATVQVKGTNKGITANENGEFELKEVDENATLLISGVGIETFEVKVSGRSDLVLSAKIKTIIGEEVVINKGYYLTTRRLNTGNVSKISAATIANQAVSNPLQALQGRVAGLYIAPSSGLPGANYSILLRGQNSLKQGNQPLFIVDGVPMMLNSGTLSQIAAVDINNPLSSINPLDIESVEVLKDADATAIYGSQAANGVILITTKKAKAGESKLEFAYSRGAGSTTRPLPVLNTSEYLKMRKEAFANDGVTPTLSNAPDLLLWDSTAFTDWRSDLIGGVAKLTSVQMSYSSGLPTTQFTVSGNYFKETTVFPFDKPSERGTARFQINNVSSNKKFKSAFVTSYSIESRPLPTSDLTAFILLPPNTPAAIDSLGNITWQNWVTGVDNPYARVNTLYSSKANTWTLNMVLQYNIFSNLSAKLNAGSNVMDLNEKTAFPIKSLRPSASTTGSLRLASNRLNSYIIEPQLDFIGTYGKLEINTLIGGSLQRRLQSGSVVNGSGYTNDDLINTLSGAAQVTASNSNSLYKYVAVFGRLNLNLKKRYLLNINVRRDGSSRFGPAKRFANFYSASSGWVFSEEHLFKSKPSFFSFGKLRISYGVTGNDQIGDYRFFDSWASSSQFTYQQVPGILPARLFNPYFEWERNRKLELAIEAGFFKDRLFITAARYQNRSDNQLVNYKLPYTTGFTTIQKNLDALIENSGVEVEITSKNLIRSKFQWATSLNITIPRTILKRYPNLEYSTDRFNYTVGESLNSSKGFGFLGVDPASGIYLYQDIDGNGTITSPNDFASLLATDRSYYGGLGNDFTWGNWSLNIFLQFTRQKGRNYLAAMPGTMSNQPAYVMERWTKPGDATQIQRFSAVGGPTSAAYQNFLDSDGSIVDASFVRLKNIYFAYSLPKSLTKNSPIKGLRVSLQIQNLLTLTKYKGADPEVHSIVSLPPLKVISGNIQLTL